MIQKKEARNGNFILMIGDDRNLSFSVQSSNVADVSLGVANYNTGQKQIKIPDNVITQTPFVVDVILSDDISEWVESYKWLLECKNANNGLDKAKPCFLQTLDSQNQPGTEFIYSDAWPIEISGLQYVTTDDGLRVLTFTLTMEYNVFKIRLPNGETIDESYGS